MLPAGYGLGHTHLGRGNLWGLGELNLERKNAYGVTYRTVMSRFFREAERLYRAGVPFDAMWDLADRQPAGYARLIRIREDDASPLQEWSVPGDGPVLSLEVTGRKARATIVEHAAPVFYTTGADATGVYRNAKVMWELFGPAEEDYKMLSPGLEVEIPLDRPGSYRLRAAVCDTAGRTGVVWRTLTRP
jgi:hypothetical protein